MTPPPPLNATHPAVQDAFIGYLLEAAALSRGDGPAEAALPARAPLYPLGTVAFMLGSRVAEFLTVTVPQLLPQLSRVNEGERVESHSGIRGRIDWAATYKARLDQHNDHTLYVCRRVRRQYATPENELLQYALERLRTAILDVPPLLRQGVYWSSLHDYAPRSVDATLVDLHERILRFQRHVYLREVEPPEQITSLHLLRARTSKTEWYAEVAELVESHQSLAVEANERALVAALRQCVIRPAQLEGIGEEMARLSARMSAR